MNEHWKTENGVFKGLFTVNPHLATSSSHDDGSVNNLAYWDKVDQIVRAYVQLHPREVADCLLEAKQARDFSYTAFGEADTPNLEIRHPAKVPVGLLRVLEATNPEIFEDRNYYTKFLKLHPGFSASPKI